jgi:peptidoglycan hydrolase FlgJ
MPESAAQASRKSKLLEMAVFCPQSRSATVAINPPSDILSDVAAAAHPRKLQEATQRLETAGTEAAAAANFALAMNAVNGAKTPDAAVTATGLPASTTKAPDAPIAQQSRPEALKKFEAFFLQTFVDSILPKNATSVFGTGTAGEVWRSMLSEHMAAEIAKSSKFGIAERLAGNHFNAPPQQSLAGPKTEPGDKNLPYVKEPGKAQGLSALAPAAADLIRSSRS